MALLIDLAPLAIFLLLLFSLWGFLARVAPAAWAALQRSARQLATRVMNKASESPAVGQSTKKPNSAGIYLAVVLILSIGAFLAFWCGDTFLDLAEMIRDKSPLLTKIDSGAHFLAEHHRGPFSTLFFVGATIVGGPVGLGVIVLAVTILLLLRNHFRWAIYLAGTVGGGAVINLLLKNYFQRQRPDLAVALRQAQGYSFPSGHAMGSMIAFIALSYVAVRALRSWNQRSFCIALAICLILAVGASRIYLGVHWISDVGAGFAAGLLWAGATTLSYELFRNLRRLREARRPPDKNPA